MYYSTWRNWHTSTPAHCTGYWLDSKTNNEGLQLDRTLAHSINTSLNSLLHAYTHTHIQWYLASQCKCTWSATDIHVYRLIYIYACTDIDILRVCVYGWGLPVSWIMPGADSSGSVYEVDLALWSNSLLCEVEKIKVSNSVSHWVACKVFESENNMKSS